MLKIDQVAGTIQLICEPAPPESKMPGGTLTIKVGGTNSKLSIEAGPAGVIDLKTGAGGTVNIDGGANLNLKSSANVKIESTAMVEITGKPIKLN